VHETPVSAGLGIGVAALAAFGDVLAAGFSLGNFRVGHANPLFLFQKSFTSHGGLHRTGRFHLFDTTLAIYDF
jgi:hypothetical protein